jgi:hypothetical protein
VRKKKDKNKKLIIILSVSAGLLLFILGVVSVLKYNMKIEKTISQKKKEIAKHSTIVAKKEGVEARLQYLQNQRADFDRKLLSGDTPAVAAAELQTILNDMASEFDLMIASQRIITPKERGIFLEVPVQITTQCTITKLKELLYQIETYSKFLSISSLDVRVVRARDPKDVKATIDISGFILNRNGIS